MSENPNSTQVTISKSFYDKMKQVSQKLGEAVSDRAIEIVSNAVDISPVDTGAFVESWQVNPRGDRTARSRSSAGRPRLPEGAKQAKREEEKARLIGRIESLDTENLDGLTITNRAPHIGFMNNNDRIKEPYKKPNDIFGVIGATLRDKYT